MKILFVDILPYRVKLLFMICKAYPCSILQISRTHNSEKNHFGIIILLQDINRKHISSTYVYLYTNYKEKTIMKVVNIKDIAACLKQYTESQIKSSGQLNVYL